jgi:Gas vesicle synthesis protein GvpO
MADDVREGRAEGRERRRSLAAKPFEELDEAAGNGDGSSGLDGLKRAVLTVLAAALAGALGGGAKAMLDKRGQRPESDEDSGDAREPADEPATDTSDQDTPQPTMLNGDDPGDAPREDEREEEEDAGDRAVNDESDGRDERGASQSDAARLVSEAKAHLKELLGEDAESVSGLERSNGRWTVSLEVVEVRRIPDSQDVLSSYDVALDEDGGVISLNRKRRYRRSQVEEQR